MDRLLLNVTVNGTACVGQVEPRMTLADFLRNELRLTGTHLGCEQGACGACTVLIDGSSARSCLVFAAQVDGSEIVTVEGLASDGSLDRLQAAFQEHHGLQCGFCTPGFLLSAMELLRELAHPGEEQVRTALSGNLCRCTGYEGIIDAVLAVAEVEEEGELAADSVGAGEAAGASSRAGGRGGGPQVNALREARQRPDAMQQRADNKASGDVQ